ncbi:MAG: hypothetical protein JZD41_02150 [Thermoproteus sp.]|nr:hypothetical protein [Thermoproteus sp.]
MGKFTVIIEKGGDRIRLRTVPAQSLSFVIELFAYERVNDFYVNKNENSILVSKSKKKIILDILKEICKNKQNSADGDVIELECSGG